jgi:DNA-directed RNA polymerase subunit alpha
MSSEEVPTGYIRVDAFFSPVRKVSYSVENTRVGQATDLDMLKLEITTDGTVAPKEALLSSINTLSEVGSKISQSLSSSTASAVSSGAEKSENSKPATSSSGVSGGVDSSADVSVLELSNRTLNVLKNNGIYTLDNLANVKLSSIAGAGQKAKEEIKSKAEKFNLTIKE